MSAGSTPLASQVYGVGVASLQAWPILLAEFGCDPQQVISAAGVDITIFDNPRNRITVDALGRLAEISLQATGCGHFGLLVGQRTKTQALGIIWRLMRHSATIGKACRSLVRHNHLQDQGAVPLLIPMGPQRVALGYSVLRHETPAVKQIHDGGLAILFNLLRELCGPAWRPLVVHCAHSAPKDTAPYRQFFGARVEFDANFSALVFASDWLEHPIIGADPAEHAAILRQIEQLEDSEQTRLSDQVRRALQSMVFSGTASIDGIAHLFELHERTLRRRLKLEGTSVLELIQEATFAVAQQLLRETSLSVSEIAAALYYNDTAAFSNAFRRWSGSSPRDWRMKARSEDTKAP